MPKVGYVQASRVKADRVVGPAHCQAGLTRFIARAQQRNISQANTIQRALTQRKGRLSRRNGDRSARPGKTQTR